MYVIINKYRNRIAKNKGFLTYDQARCYLRSMLRARGYTGRFRNPPVTTLGHTIRKIHAPRFVF